MLSRLPNYGRLVIVIANLHLILIINLMELPISPNYKCYCQCMIAIIELNYHQGQNNWRKFACLCRLFELLFVIASIFRQP